MAISGSLGDSLGAEGLPRAPMCSQGLPGAPQGASEGPNSGNLHFPELGPSTEILVDLGGSPWESMGIHGNLWEPRRSSGSAGSPGAPRSSQGLPGDLQCDPVKEICIFQDEVLNKIQVEPLETPGSLWGC
jgi:hypothetical protein